MIDAGVEASDRLMSDLNRLCDFGGRLAGTPSEAAARDWLAEVGAQAMGTPVKRHEVVYDGWQAIRVSLVIPGFGEVEAHPLLKSAPTPEGGIEAQVLDLGRGIEDDFARAGSDVRGKIAIVRHEVMFSDDTFHRRKKLQLAKAAGACAVLVVSRTKGGPVTGSARANENTLPALGISPETADQLLEAAEKGRNPKLAIETKVAPATATNLIFDRPGASGKTVVLSAHYDGHDLAESALDNASGVAVCLEVARRLSKTNSRHGLRLAFFTVEEWGLLGSHRYLESLGENLQKNIILNINADTVGDGAGLTALTSGFAGLSNWLCKWSQETGRKLGIFEPFQANSDNASFARFGIPAFRLVSGFNEPNTAVKHVLTNRDTRALIQPSAMALAADMLEQVARKALDASDAEIDGWRIPTKSHVDS